MKGLRPNSWTKSRQSLKEFSSLLFTVTSTALPWDYYFFSALVYIHCKGERRKPHPLPYGLRNPYRNLKSEKSQDYAQKPQRNCTFMNSVSGRKLWKFKVWIKSLKLHCTVLYSPCRDWNSEPLKHTQKKVQMTWRSESMKIHHSDGMRG